MEQIGRLVHALRQNRIYRLLHGPSAHPSPLEVIAQWAAMCGQDSPLHC
jgi:hypothetical protein